MARNSKPVLKLWPWPKQTFRYSPLSAKECPDDSLQPDTTACARVRTRIWLPVSLSLLVLATAAFYFVQHLDVVKTTTSPAQLSIKACADIQTRREWRSLSDAEKGEYIRAVKCLTTTRSKMGINGTLYDDFPWTHAQAGGSTHGAAPFFSWHRYFLHVFEKELRSSCDYEGSLVYWDWTLDWQDMPRSPVFSPYHGFGGNGNVDSPVTVGFGHCVESGPFAGVQALYYDVDQNTSYQPHCLSRGFGNGTSPDAPFDGYGVRPEAIERVLAIPKYSDFFLAVENGPHNVIPNGIRGDFYEFTAPYDPLFYLHHTQLDRLWWLWQKTGPKDRLWEYNGPAERHAGKPAELTDRLSVAPLAREVSVFEIMDTESQLLCYRY